MSNQKFRPEGPKPENGIVGGFVKARAASANTVGPANIEAPRAKGMSGATLDISHEKELRQKAHNTEWKNGGQPKGRRVKLSMIGVPEHLMDQADPEYKKALKDAAVYRKYRSRELCVAHGYVSAGASSLLTTASLALAASRYLYGRVCVTGDVALLKTASQLADSARQNELAAWELAAREGTARRKAAAVAVGVPWLSAEPEKPKPGRPRKEALAAKEAEETALAAIDPTVIPPPPTGGDLMGWVQSLAEADVKK